MLNDPFDRARLPAAFSREGRIKLLAEAADALIAGELPSSAARLFLGSALRAWLHDGGRLGALERDFLKVGAPARSTITASKLWARMQGSALRATADQEPDTIAASEAQEPQP